MERSEPSTDSASTTRTAIDIAIRLGVLAIVLAACYQIIRPFVSPVIWGIIIAVTLYPVYEKINARLGDRRKVTATLMTLVLLAVIILPAIQLAVTSADSLHSFNETLGKEDLKIPPPPEGVGEWPVVGPAVEEFWQDATLNLQIAMAPFKQQIVAFAKWILATFLGVAGGVLLFAISLVIAGILMASAKSGGMVTRRIFVRLAGAHGEEMVGLAIQTIRGVVKGVIGVSIVQALLVGLGFAVAGIPAAGLWAFLCLVLAIIQIGVGPVVIVVIIYAFSTMGKVSAILLTIWLVLVTVSDGPMKAVLLGRGAAVPMLVIFLGSIGGFMAIGFLGLFIGAVVLSVGYKLAATWMDVSAPV